MDPEIDDSEYFSLQRGIMIDNIIVFFFGAGITLIGLAIYVKLRYNKTKRL